MPTARTRRRGELIGPESPTVGYFLMSPDQGGHTSMPVFGMRPPSYAEIQRVRHARHRAARLRSDGRRRERPLRRGAALELHRRRDRRELDDRAAGNPRCGAGSVSRARWCFRRCRSTSAPAQKFKRGQLLRPRRTVRRALERGELPQSVLRHADVDRVLQRRRAHLGHPRAAGADGSRVLRARSECEHRSRTAT